MEITDKMMRAAGKAYNSKEGRPRVEAIRAALEAALSAQAQDVAGWQSMDAAPKDGKHCLLAVKTGPFVYAVQGAFLDGEWENVACINSEPFCWMALNRIPPVYLPWTDEFAAEAPAKQEGAE